jgi:eukaryotic-like serine/threonine-protein kinase
VFSTPTVVADVMFIGSCAGNFYAINKTTGELQWSYDIRRDGNQQSFHGDPLVTTDLILIGTDKSCDPPATNGNSLFIVGQEGVIYSLDASSDRVSWKLKLPGAPSTGLALRDKTIYVGTNDQRLYRLNAETGAVISELATEAKPVGRLAFANDSLFLFLQNASERVGYIISVDSKLTRIRWTQRSSPDWASERPHLWKEFVIAGNCRGGLAAFRASDGEPQWNLSLKGCIRSIWQFG